MLGVTMICNWQRDNGLLLCSHGPFEVFKWGTPVAEQYGVNSIPHLMLYNAKGRTEKSGNGFQVYQYLESIARKKGW